MPVIEVAFLNLKPNPDSLNDGWLASLKALTEPNPGMIRCAQGHVVDINGQSQEEDKSRRVLLIEWPTKSAFDTFASSPQVVTFHDAIKPHLAGPPLLELYDCGEWFSSLKSGGENYVDVIRVDISGKDSEIDGLTATEEIVSKIGLEENRIAGRSCNLERKKLLHLLHRVDGPNGFFLRDDYSERLAKIGEVERVAVKVEPVPLGK